MRTLSIFVFVSFLTSAPAIADSSRRAAAQPRALAPQAFRDAPAHVIEALVTAGCVIPQTASNEPHNLVRGQFVEAGFYDWAAVCSRRQQSAILLISSRPGRCPEYALHDDSSYLQQTHSGERQYSRKIRRLTERDLARRATDLPATIRKSIDHDGIEDMFLGKASTIYYCKDGQWLHIDGAD